MHPIIDLSDDSFGWFLAGLADGEGCFDFRGPVRIRPGGSQRPLFDGTFSIAMRDDEKPGLAAIHQRLGIGRLYTDPAASRSGKGNPQIKWEVGKSVDLAKVIIPLFDQYPLMMKKSRDYRIWRQCILLWYECSLRPLMGKTPTKSIYGPRASRMTDQECLFLLDKIQELRNIRKYVPPSI